jgi:hypothetical protein
MFFCQALGITNGASMTLDEEIAAFGFENACGGEGSWTR